MASSASGQTVLESLPARPPTPPREPSIRAADQSLKPVLSRTVSTDSHSSLQTPPNVTTPSSAATESEIGSTSARVRKKVGWSIHTQYKDPPQYREGHRAYKSSPLSAPSSSLSKPVKGILKVSSSPHTLSPSLEHELNGLSPQATITEMLDSTIKQLAGADRESKLDAYMMLSRALKTSNNLPDRVALQDKMSLFTQFIQRDVTSKTEKGTLDSSLVNHALNLLATFLHFPAIASMLATDFAIFITEHSIRSFQQPTMPKDIIRHLMQVVAFQNFSSKVMTLDRVGRLVAALHSIEDHVKGKSVIMGRIQIYKRLVKQARPHMAVHSDWLKDVLTDMLSTIKDIRSQAITLGLEASFSLRSDKQFMRKATEILQTTSDDDQKYISFYILQLEEMMKDKTCSSAVPQIWSAVTALLRCPLDRWEYYKPWLKLAQSAFNSADVHTKQEANYAWSRYVYLCLLGGNATSKTLGVLYQPLLSQLRRKPSAKPTEDASKLRRSVFGAICTLLYYVFKPNNNAYSQDMVWDVVVQPIMTQLSSATEKSDSSGDDFMQGVRILVGLLDVSTPRVWREERIMDPSLVKPDELPSIDPKWARRNSAKILHVVGPILKKKAIDLAKEETVTYRLWLALVGSVSAASRKDIKVSEDTTRFFAGALGVLSYIWAECVTAQDQTVRQRVFASFQNYTKILLEGVGLLPFTEKKLIMSASHTYDVVSALNHQHLERDTKGNGDAKSPLHHLFLMLSSDAIQQHDDHDFIAFYLGTFEPFFSGKPHKVRLEMARELIELLPRNMPSATGPWILAAKHIGGWLESDSGKQPSKVLSSARLLGPEYREVVSLLERGTTKDSTLSDEWVQLFNAISDHTMASYGHVGRGIVLLDPLAKFLLENCIELPASLSKGVIQATQMLLDATMPLEEWQALETTRQQLWGIPASTKRGSTVPAFESLNQLGSMVLEILYRRYSDFDPMQVIRPFIQTIQSYLERHLKQKDGSCFQKLQDALCLWICDGNGYTTPSDTSPMAQTLESLWHAINNYMVGHEPLDRRALDDMEPFLTAGLRSQNPVISKKAIDTWNHLSKSNQDLDCSESLKSVISSLLSKANSNQYSGQEFDGDFGAQHTSFVGLQGEPSFIASSTSSRLAEQPVPNEPKPGLRSASRRRKAETTLDVVPKRRSARNTPKLRHDNSQLQFASIISSPPAEESQHLTEHQKDVRERQRENAVMYAQIQSSSPGQSSARSTRQSKRKQARGSDNEHASTPKRATSYEELISSTPTPRRGQMLHLDELNDPPSSPPEPRPYPLLTEIRLRSRRNNSLEDWEFSSPPTSPVPSRQQVNEETELPDVTLTNDTTQHKGQSQNTNALDVNMNEIIPSSFDVDLTPVARLKRKRRSLDAEDKSIRGKLPPRSKTPPQNQEAFNDSKVQETPKSGDDEFVDARSSPEPTSPNLPPLRSQLQTRKEPLDILDNDSNASAVESETRTENLPVQTTTSKSPEKRTNVIHKDECILVQADSSPTRVTRSTGLIPVSPDVSSITPQELSELKEDFSKKRKRRGSKNSENRRKKRRSENRNNPPKTEAAEHQKQETSNLVPEENSSQEKIAGVQTRRSLKRQRQQEAKASAVAEKLVSEPVEADGGDTDEELMSQLVTESEAASQSQSQHEAETVHDTTMDADPERKNGKRRRSERRARDEPKHDKANEKATQILDTLRSGLGVLRDAKLSRENVYEIEDILMDMKRELFQAEQRGRERSE